MPNSPSPRAHYKERIRDLEAELKKLSRYSRIFFVSRSLFFLAFIALLVLYIKSDYNSTYLWLSGIALAAFLATVKWDMLYQAREKLVKTKIIVNNNELKYLDYDFAGFSDGKDYESLNPALAGDLDIFGEGSLFQYLNRAVTRNGTAEFAQGLCEPLQQAKTIRAKQEAIDELSRKTDFVEFFRSHGMLTTESGDEANRLKQWLNQPPNNLLKMKIISYAYPLFLIIWIIFIATGLLSTTSILVPLITAYLILYFYGKRISAAHHNLDKSATTFKKYGALIHRIDSETFQSEHLVNLKNNFSGSGVSASKSLKKLFKLIEVFDYRNNMIVSPVLNGLFVFDLHIYSALQKWKEKHKSRVPGWFDSLSAIDALLSYAVFRFNNLRATFPRPMEGPFVFEARELGHPLIPLETRVDNDVSLHENPAILVITGANMAGKSTFLRAIAVNLVLAMNGAPVCARQMQFTPCPLATSVNIRDSLAQNESYFYAELVRIKNIIQQVNAHPMTLVFLDEILRGTNSQDKHTGTVGLLEKLIALGAIVVVATHDLGVGRLAEKYPGIAHNHCFEVELDNDQLVFDYKLKPGVSQKLNASFLMHKMGLID